MDEARGRPHEERLGVVGPGESSVCGGAARVEFAHGNLGEFVGGEFVDHFFGGCARRGPLAAADRPQIPHSAVDVVVQLVTTAGRVGVAIVVRSVSRIDSGIRVLDEGTDTDRGEFDIVEGERGLGRRHGGVHRVEDQIDIVGSDRWIGFGDRRVGGADERLAHPRRHDHVTPRLRAGEHGVANHTATQWTRQHVHTLRPIDTHAGGPSEGGQHLVDPGAGCVHHDPSAHFDRTAAESVGGADSFHEEVARHVATHERVDGDVIDENGTGRRRRLRIREQQPLGVQVECVVIGEAALQSVGVKPRHSLQQRRLRQPLRMRNAQTVGSGHVAIERQRVVQQHTGADEGCGRLAPAPCRHDELRLLHEMRSAQGEDASLTQTLANHRHVVLLEIANTAVDVLGGGGAGARSEVVAFEQSRAQSP